MSQVKIRNTLTQLMYDFDQSRTDLDVRYSNTNNKLKTDQIWLGFTINMGQQSFLEIGNRPLTEQLGMIDIQIYVPLNTDTLAGYTLADELISHFFLANVQDIDINPAQITAQNTENYYQINVKFPFVYA